MCVIAQVDSESKIHHQQHDGSMMAVLLGAGLLS
jgi:hypothetical protein